MTSLNKKLKKRYSDMIHEFDFPLAIGGAASPVMKEEIRPDVNMATHRADDEYLIISNHSPAVYYFIGCFLCLFALFGIYTASESTEIWIGCLLIVLFAVLLFVYGYTIPNRLIILDRQNGLITLPGRRWNNPVTYPFNEASALLGVSGWPPIPTLNIRRPNGKGAVVLAVPDQLEFWNLFVWYMDKNRPLPPGTAFDPYRKKDYERRKKEGFPPPLYKSVVHTPEDPSDRKFMKPITPHDDYY